MDMKMINRLACRLPVVDPDIDTVHILS